MIVDTGSKFYHYHPTYAYDLKVKITDLDILYSTPDNVKFMITNAQTIAQEILSRTKMP